MADRSKREMRKQLLSLRPGSSEGLSQRLIELAQNLGSLKIASYVPLPNEPDLTDFNAWVAKDRELFLPRIEGDDLVFAQGELVSGDFGILQPTGSSVALGELELVVVPALAADALGNRLGKGKGFYDRTLANLKAKTIAVVFDQELLDQLPVEEHDQRVDYVVTPNRTLFCGR